MVETNWTAVNSVSDLLGLANGQTSGWFWTAMNIMIFLVVLITLSATSGSWVAGAMTALFMGLMIQMFLVYLGLGAWWVVGCFVGGLLGLIIYMMWSNKYD